MLRSRRPPFGGLVLGLVFLCLSLTPSLVPRSWLLQGLVTGVSTAIGYGLGVMGSALLRQVLPREPTVSTKRAAWRTFVGAGAVAAIVAVVLAGRWQQQLHVRMGAEEPAQPAYLAVLAVAAALTLVLVLAGRGVRRALATTGTWLRRWLPPRTAALTSATLVALLAAAVVQGLVGPMLFSLADRSFAALNETVTDDVPPPTDPHVSGGPGSLTTWEDVGTQGRKFVTRTTGVEELGDFLAERDRDVEPVAPIRVYAGLDATEDVAERAELAVAELERTGAFDRSVLAVAAATGTGWVNPTASAALEHLRGGDTAIVAMQYSYLPSWLSFMVDRERAAEAGRALFGAVHERWAELPADDRPQLIVYGESLGSYAIEAAFDDLADLRARTQGAVLVGPPSANPLRRDLLREREAGTPAHRPVVDDGRTVRFAARAADLDHPDRPWPHPRVVYLQHASDPVVWWSPTMAFRRPAWLTEPRGDDVLPAMRWFPVVTFWQLSADLALADEVPAGYGHDYGTQVVDSWVAVLDPADWDDGDTERLRTRLEERHDPVAAPAEGSADGPRAG
jgi:uncharacterized membrane protein